MRVCCHLSFFSLHLSLYSYGGDGFFLEYGGGYRTKRYSDTFRKEAEAYKNLDNPNNAVAIGTASSKEAFLAYFSTPEQAKECNLQM